MRELRGVAAAIALLIGILYLVHTRINESFGLIPEWGEATSVPLQSPSIDPELGPGASVNPFDPNVPINGQPAQSVTDPQNISTPETSQQPAGVTSLSPEACSFRITTTPIDTFHQTLVEATIPGISIDGFIRLTWGTNSKVADFQVLDGYGRTGFIMPGKVPASMKLIFSNKPDFANESTVCSADIPLIRQGE